MNRFRLNLIWEVASNLVTGLCTWLVVVVLSNLQGPEPVGILEMARSYAMPAFALADMNMLNAQATDLREQFAFGTYLRFRLIALWFAMLAALIAGWATQSSPAVLAATGAVMLFLIQTGIERVFYAEFIRHELIRLRSVSRIAKGVLGISAFTAGFYLTHSVAAGMLAMVGLQILVLLGWDLKHFRQLPPTLIPENDDRHKHGQGRLWHLLWICLPLGIATFLGVLSISLVRYLLGQYHGETVLGIFGIVWSVSLVFNPLQVALHHVLLPRMAHAYANGQIGVILRLGAKMTGLCLLASCLLLAGAVVLGPWALRTVYGLKAGAYADYLTLAVLVNGLMLTSRPLHSAAHAVRAFPAMPWIYGLSLLATITVGWWAIVHWAVAGALLSIALALTIQIICLAWLVYRYLQSPPPPAGAGEAGT